MKSTQIALSTLSFLRLDVVSTFVQAQALVSGFSNSCPKGKHAALQQDLESTLNNSFTQPLFSFRPLTCQKQSHRPSLNVQCTARPTLEIVHNAQPMSDNVQPMLMLQPVNAHANDRQAVFEFEFDQCSMTNCTTRTTKINHNQHAQHA